MRKDEALGAPADIHAKDSIVQKKSTYIGKAQVVEPKRTLTKDEKTEMTGGRSKEHHVNPEPDPVSKTSGNEDFEETQDPEIEERIVRVKFPVKYRVFSDDINGQTIYTLIIHSPQDEENAYLTLTPVGETDDKSCNVHIQTCSIGQAHENEISNVPLTEGKNVITFCVDNSGEYAFSLLAEHNITIKEQML